MQAAAAESALTARNSNKFNKIPTPASNRMAESVHHYQVLLNTFPMGLSRVLAFEHRALSSISVGLVRGALRRSPVCELPAGVWCREFAQAHRYNLLRAHELAEELEAGPLSGPRN